MPSSKTRKPPWLTVPLPDGSVYRCVRRTVTEHRLHTVCQEARCPNVAECWGAGTATFLILGDVCTRGCDFCGVARGERGASLDPTEPQRVAEAARKMGLSYVVLTSVTRDDLPDGGSSAFAATLEALRALPTPPLTELLVPDFEGAALETVLGAAPAVFAHNVEVVERLTPALRHGAFSYRRSLRVLRRARERSHDVITKSSLMLGLGETDAEIHQTLDDLLEAGVSILVLGQYLQPTGRHAPVRDYITPESFDRWSETAKAMGFEFVAAGPLVRTSYRAAEAYVQHHKGREVLPQSRTPG